MGLVLENTVCIYSQLFSEFVYMQFGSVCSRYILLPQSYAPVVNCLS